MVRSGMGSTTSRMHSPVQKQKKEHEIKEYSHPPTQQKYKFAYRFY